MGIFVLCCTGSCNGICKRLAIPVGSVAAASLLCAALSCFTLPVGSVFSVQPACVLPVAAALLLCRGQRETPVSVLLAFFCGISGWLMQRAYPDFFEIALLTALPAAVLGRILPLPARQGLLCTLLAPFFYGLVAAVESWYLFDGAVLSCGSAQQLDMQICGAFAFSLLTGVRMNKLKKCEAVQKEY